jgi:hypothetical protein
MSGLIAIDSEDFVFEEDGHLYKTSEGIVRPSITQMMQAAGIYDFSRVPRDVLENARRRGTNVHRWCQEWDLYGSIDESWIADDEMPYVEAWIKFKRDSKIVIRKVETPMLRPIAGVLIGGTPDVEGFIGSRPVVVERKACRAVHIGWGVQTALQEMLITGKPRVGHIDRIAVQLKPNGDYKAIPHEDSSDGDAGLALVQKVGAEDAIRNWMSNKGLLRAA